MIEPISAGFAPWCEACRNRLLLRHCHFLTKVRPMRKPFLLCRLMLIFALLFTQLGGLTHGIAHTMAAQAQDQALPHDKHCDLCAAYAQLGSAIGSGGSGFANSASCEAIHFSHFASRIPDTFAAFAARAPPYSV